MTIGTIIFWILLASIIFSFPFLAPRLKKWIRGNELLSFILDDKKKEINIAIIVIEFTLILILLTQIIGGKNIFPIEKVFNGLNWWSEILDPLLGAAIVLIALGIWVNKNQKEWEDSIEKTLTVIFKHENQEVMRCVRAYLAGESDIRQWAQQIGGQMSLSLLEFEPFIDPKPSVIDFRDKQWYKDYYVIFNLRNLPYPSYKEINELDIETVENDNEMKQIIEDKNNNIRKRNEHLRNQVNKIYITLYQKKGCIVWYPNENSVTKKKYYSRDEFNEFSVKENSKFYIDPEILK
jgi:hypothetical protein